MGRGQEHTINKGNGRNWLCFLLPTGAFMDKPVSSERRTQKVRSGNGSQTARKDDSHEHKNNILLQTEKVLPEKT